MTVQAIQTKLATRKGKAKTAPTKAQPAPVAPAKVAKTPANRTGSTGFAYKPGGKPVTSKVTTWNYHWLTLLLAHTHTDDAVRAVIAKPYHEPVKNARATLRNSAKANRYRLGATDFAWALKQGYIVRV